MKKILFATLISLASSFSSADLLADIQKANPGATPYEVLKTLYKQAPQAAQVTDFDGIGNGSPHASLDKFKKF